MLTQSLSKFVSKNLRQTRSNRGARGILLQYTPTGTSANSPGALLTGATMNVRGTTTLPDKPQ